MKTKEELKALKEEVEFVDEKLRELTPEELEQVTGGRVPFVKDLAKAAAQVDLAIQQKAQKNQDADNTGTSFSVTAGKMSQSDMKKESGAGAGVLKMPVRKKLLISVLLAAAVVLITHGAIAAGRNRITSLNVVTLPLLMNEEYAQELLVEMWAEIEPEITLNFVKRSYGSVDYPEEIDVLEFDFENIGYLSRLGYFRELDPADIRAYDQLIPFAKENLTVGGKIYGVPQLLCGNYLVYHRGDAEMDEVESFADLIEVMERGHTEGLPITSDADKVWIDFGRQYAYYALDGMVDDHGTYEPFSAALVEEHMPEIYDLFDRVMDWSMETEDGNADPTAFGAGQGRAVLCYSEKIWETGLPAEDLVIRPIAFADGPNIPLAYLDSVAVSDWVKDEKRYEKCLELVDLMTSKEYVERLLTYQGKPQYFVPARDDVFKEYAEKYPLYAELYSWLAEKTPFQFRAGDENLKDLIKWVKEYRKKRDEEQLAEELKDAA